MCNLGDKVAIKIAPEDWPKLYSDIKYGTVTLVTAAGLTVIGIIEVLSFGLMKIAVIPGAIIGSLCGMVSIGVPTWMQLQSGNGYVSILTIPGRDAPGRDDTSETMFKILRRSIAVAAIESEMRAPHYFDLTFFLLESLLDDYVSYVKFSETTRVDREKNHKRMIRMAEARKQSSEEHARWIAEHEQDMRKTLLKFKETEKVKEISRIKEEYQENMNKAQKKYEEDIIHEDESEAIIDMEESIELGESMQMLKKLEEKRLQNMRSIDETYEKNMKAIAEKYGSQKEEYESNMLEIANMYQEYMLQIESRYEKEMLQMPKRTQETSHATVPSIMDA